MRLSNINESLWFDEALYTRWRLEAAKYLWYWVRVDIHPPVYHIFMFFWIHIFGDSEISIRIPSLICGILSIFLVYVMALRFSDRRTALLSSFLMCASPVHIWYSQEARLYSPMLCLLLLALFSYHELNGPKAGRTWYLVYFCSLLLAVLTHYFVMVYLILLTIMCLFKTSPVKRNILILNLAMLAPMALFLVWKVVSSGRIVYPLAHLRYFTFFELWMLFFNWFLSGNTIWCIQPYTANVNTLLRNPLMLFTQILFLIIFVRGLILHFNKSKKPYNLDIILYLFSLPLALWGLSLFGLKCYIERTALISLPFFYLILAQGITGFKTKNARIIAIASIVIFNLVVLVNFFAKNDKWTVYKQNSDWRSAAAYFNDERKNSDEAVSIFATTSAGTLAYYELRFRKLAEREEKAYIPWRIYPKKKNTQDIYGELVAANIKVFYLIKDEYWPSYFNTLLKSIEDDPRFQFLDRRSFKGIRIFKYNRK